MNTKVECEALTSDIAINMRNDKGRLDHLILPATVPELSIPLGRVCVGPSSLFGRCARFQRN